jgi:hypothetical protein
MTAIASLTNEPMSLMQITDKGEVNIKMLVSEVTEVEPVKYEMIWARESKR